MTEDIKQRVRQFIFDNFLMGAAQELPDDASFIDRHVIDSTGFLELIAFLEDSYGFRIEDDEMIPENLDSIANVERFVRLKTGARAAAAVR